MTALFGHALALRLFYGEGLPRRLRVANLLALATTAAVMAILYALGPPPWRIAGVVAAWLIGHVAWGIYLAARIRSDPRRTSADAPPSGGRHTR